MDARELINYKALSRLLTDNDTSIRKDRVPKQYRDQVREAEILMEYYISKQRK